MILSIITTGAVVMTAYFAYKGVNTALNSFKSNTEPLVIPYLKTHPRHGTAINFAIKNVGAGAARNVIFKFDNPSEFVHRKIFSSDVSKNAPIGMIPQGDKIEMFFGMAHELLKSDAQKKFNVTIEYENVKGEKTKKEYVLDVTQFEGWTSLGTPAEHEIAESLKKIEKHISRVIGYRGRVKVETMNQSELRQQQEEDRKRVEEQNSS